MAGFDSLPKWAQARINHLENKIKDQAKQMEEEREVLTGLEKVRYVHKADLWGFDADRDIIEETDLVIPDGHRMKIIAKLRVGDAIIVMRRHNGY
jgi:UDP-N-acetyl-D-mannosaminuronic acid transferase (WecB/TagA/CpsF family)